MEETKYISELSVEREFDTHTEQCMTTLTVKYSSNVSVNDLLDALSRYAPVLFADDEDETYEPLPDAERVIFNAPATVVLWTDGTKTISKARGGDEYDPLFGLVACIVRKLTHNKGHAVDDFEGLINELNDGIQSPEDIDGLTDFCLLTLDILTTLRCSSDKWLPQLGEPDVPEDTEKAKEELRSMVAKIEVTQDEIRQMVRNLTLEGEL